MFGDKVSQVKEMFALKKQMDEMKKKMEKITVEVTEGEYTILMRGDQRVESVQRNGDEVTVLKNLFNKAVKESQKRVSKNMRSDLQGLGLPGL